MPDVAAGPESQPDRICERDELRRTLAQAMGRLPRRYQKVLVLHYDNNLTMKHISGLLGVSAGRISQIRRKALHKMSEELQSVGFFPAQMPHYMAGPHVTRACADWSAHHTRFPATVPRTNQAWTQHGGTYVAGISTAAAHLGH
jgi:hypothetical protein